MMPIRSDMCCRLMGLAALAAMLVFRARERDVAAFGVIECVATGVTGRHCLGILSQHFDRHD